MSSDERSHYTALINKGYRVSYSDPFGLCPMHLTGRPCGSPLQSGIVDIRSDVFSGFGRSSERSSGIHQGVDLLTPIGSEVTAVDDGVVVGTGTSKTWGNYVILGHKDADGNVVSYSAYMHLSSVGVKRGDSIGRSQVIGASGDTGNAKGTPPHLHFELWTGFGAATAGSGLNHRLDPVLFLPPPGDAIWPK